MKTCGKCKQEKLENDFTTSEYKKKSGRCRICVKEANKNWNINNKEKRKAYKQTDEYKQKSKEYKLKTKPHIQEWSKEYYINNKERINQYYIDNREKIILRTRKWEKQKLISDPQYKLRKNISAYLRSTLKSKNKESVLKYLPYTMEELKTHLEGLFEPWMSWTNHGVYKPSTWNDNDPSTWTWNIDHIVPHSLFKYNNIQDENFKKCWALENLRPLSAKQNVIDGTNRTRHK